MSYHEVEVASGSVFSNNLIFNILLPFVAVVGAGVGLDVSAIGFQGIQIRKKWLKQLGRLGFAMD